MWKIIFHWSGGPYVLTEADFNHYHFTVGPDGLHLPGRFSPQDNIPPLKPGKYAAHTGGGNSYAIGIALRGMAGATENGVYKGTFPITLRQSEGAWALGARKCFEYGIKPDKNTVMTHYEFGLRYPKTTSRGKIDITNLPFRPDLKKEQVGDYIRSKVNWYLERYKRGEA